MPTIKKTKKRNYKKQKGGAGTFIRGSELRQARRVKYKRTKGPKETSNSSSGTYGDAEGPILTENLYNTTEGPGRPEGLYTFDVPRNIPVPQIMGAPILQKVQPYEIPMDPIRPIPTLYQAEPTYFNNMRKNATQYSHLLPRKSNGTKSKQPTGVYNRLNRGTYSHLQRKGSNGKHLTRTNMLVPRKNNITNNTTVMRKKNTEKSNKLNFEHLYAYTSSGEEENNEPLPSPPKNYGYTEYRPSS